MRVQRNTRDLPIGTKFWYTSSSLGAHTVIAQGQGYVGYVNMHDYTYCHQHEDVWVEDELYDAVGNEIVRLQERIEALEAAAFGARGVGR